MKGICEKVADSCMGMRVRRVARVVGNHYDEYLKSTGLKGTQFTLLNAMYLNPTATISQIMAKEMKGDEALASSIVTATTLVSPLTLSVWISLLS